MTTDTYYHLQRPNYVIYGPNGDIEELCCKMCGSVIGSMAEQVKGRRLTPQGWVEERILRFRRHNTYAELKMEFRDGSFHVTNGCRTCLHENLTMEQLDELHCADMHQDMGAHSVPCMERYPIGIAAIRTDGGGIS